MWIHRGMTKFIPLGAEALGGFSKNLRGLLSSFSTQWEVLHRIPQSIAMSLMIKRITVEIHRSNAQQLCEVLWHCTQSSDPPEDLTLIDIVYDFETDSEVPYQEYPTQFDNDDTLSDFSVPSASQLRKFLMSS